MVASLSHPPLLTSIKIPSTLLLPILSPLDRFPLSFPSPFPSHLLWPSQPPPCTAPPCDRLTAPQSSLHAISSSNFPFDSLIIHPTLFECYCRHSPRSKPNPVEPLNCLPAALADAASLGQRRYARASSPAVTRSHDQTPPPLAHAALSRIHLVAQ